MRAVIQRVVRASVQVNGHTVGAIGRGMLVLLGVAVRDTDADAAYLAKKIAGLRIFDDQDGKMNRTIMQIGGAALVVSQFTLYGDCRKGKRPSFTDAAPPESAVRLYEEFIACLRNEGVPVATGVFQAAMQVSLVNDGPVTFLLDSSRQF
ncbi:MAG: D-aminoacyl-tRNA deacylase [Desulfobacterota bacterium]|nr:D-aminoacyl-tRNA deacylase [Thermodesulfobacteriota bacterium]